MDLLISQRWILELPVSPHLDYFFFAEPTSPDVSSNGKLVHLEHPFYTWSFQISTCFFCFNPPYDPCRLPVMNPGKPLCRDRGACVLAMRATYAGPERSAVIPETTPAVIVSWLGWNALLQIRPVELPESWIEGEDNPLRFAVPPGIS